MPRFLMFRLYGPMSSWGEIAVGFQRPTSSHPSKSAVMGLLAAALGLKRQDEGPLYALFGSYGFSTRVDSAGELLSDYHTSQAPPQSLVKKQHGHASRREELSFSRSLLKTVESRREYRTDAAAVGCVWTIVETPQWSLEDLSEALRRPRFVLYLGRKSCPPALPLSPTIVEAPDPLAALRDASFSTDWWLSSTLRQLRRTYYWEGAWGHTNDVQTAIRRDSPQSRQRWQFTERLEHMTIEEGGPNVSEQG